MKEKIKENKVEVPKGRYKDSLFKGVHMKEADRKFKDDLKRNLYQSEMGLNKIFKKNPEMADKELSFTSSFKYEDESKDKMHELGTKLSKIVFYYITKGRNGLPKIYVTPEGVAIKVDAVDPEDKYSSFKITKNLRLVKKEWIQPQMKHLIDQVNQIDRVIESEKEDNKRKERAK